MKPRFLLVLALGLSLALYLVCSVGVGAIVASALAVGWGGFAILCLYLLGGFLILGAACGVLLPEASLKGVATFVWARMVRDSATEVLPFSHVGGLLFGVRAAILGGIPQPMAFAATIVDVTTEFLAQVGYIALGISLLAAGVARTSFTQSLTQVLEMGFALAVIAGIAIVASQRYRHRIAAMLTEHLFPAAGVTTAGVTAALDAIYRTRPRVAAALALHFVGWLASAIGVFIAFRLMGSPVDLDSVLVIESLVCTARSAAFFVPNALGVQEGAYALLAPLLGVGAEVGLAVSLVKRARDIAVGIPILLIWQAAEGRRALLRHRGDLPANRA